MGRRVDLEARARVELLHKGRVVVDEDLGLALVVVERMGSLLAASRILGIAYSRLWERLARAERILGEPLVRARRGGRGGGGAELTELGVEVLNAFRRAYQRIHGVPPSPPRAAGRPGERAVLVYAGSNDPLLQRILGLLGDRGVKVEAHWLGSLQGLASVLLGDADVAGVHVVDPVTGEYNKTLLGGVAGAAHLAMVRGYRRRIGLVSRRPVSVEEALQGLLEGRLTVVNRPKGSGSRLLLERLLSEAAGLGWPPDEGLLEARVKGWDRVAATHTEVVEAVARGEADVGVAVEAAASTLGLHFTPLAWEWFDFLLRAHEDSGRASKFIEALCSDEARSIARELRGYEYSSESCERIL